ncbi:MAG: V-type ATP synthase subunit D [Candidatus Asgardarchaeia archaeon]
MSVRTMKVVPTRGFYLEFKKRVKYIEDGYKLLEMKRDELTRELRDYISQLQILREEMDKKVENVMINFRKVYALLGESVINGYIAATPKDLELDVLPKSIMGILVPFVKIVNEVNIKDKYTPLLQGVADDFKDLLRIIIKLSELEAKIDVVSDDLERTNRMVNALEKILIPEMKATLKYIEDLLDEDMLEEFMRIKLVRNIIMSRREG